MAARAWASAEPVAEIGWVPPVRSPAPVKQRAVVVVPTIGAVTVAVVASATLPVPDSVLSPVGLIEAPEPRPPVVSLATVLSIGRDEAPELEPPQSLMLSVAEPLSAALALTGWVVPFRSPVSAAFRQTVFVPTIGAVTVAVVVSAALPEPEKVELPAGLSEAFVPRPVVVLLPKEALTGSGELPEATEPPVFRTPLPPLPTAALIGDALLVPIVALAPRLPLPTSEALTGAATLLVFTVAPLFSDAFAGTVALALRPPVALPLSDAFAGTAALALRPPLALPLSDALAGIGA